MTTYIYPQTAAASGGATEATLDLLLTQVEEINARVGGSFVAEAFDYIALTYVPSGNGVGEIQTAVYKTGGAAGTTVATLTLAYDGSNRLSSVTKS